MSDKLWSTGRTLHTKFTSRWSQEEWDANEAIERSMIFEDFTSMDDGKGRVLIAKCESEDIARQIVKAHNHPILRKRHTMDIW